MNQPTENLLPVVFLDRDGTIIEDLHYPREAEKVTLLPNAVNGLKEMHRRGYPLVIVSNQSGVGRGIISDQQFREVHARVDELLSEAEIQIEEWVYCFHRPDENCECRKPKTSAVPRTIRDRNVDWAKSIVVGDRESDLQLADNLGGTGVLVTTGKGAKTRSELESSDKLGRYRVCDDLMEVAELLPALSDLPEL